MSSFSAPLPDLSRWRAAGTLALALAAALALALAPPAVRANGWQWHSIPRPALLAGLESESAAYRAYAARALGYRRDEKVIGTLVAMLEDPDEEVIVKTDILRALGRIREPAATPALIRMLRQEAEAKLRAEAAGALGALATPEALPALLEALDRKQDLVVRTQVVSALGGFTDSRAIDALARVLRTAKARTLRRQAMLALGRTGSAEAAPPLLEALAKARTDRARAAVVEALGRTGVPAARGPLTELLERTAGVALRVRITMALGTIADGSAAPNLISLLDDPVAAVQFHAVQGLAEAADPRAVAPLMELYRRLAERQAAVGLPEIRADPLPYLADLSLRFEIVRTLTALDAPAAGEVLLEAAQALEFPADSAVTLRLNEGAYELRRAAIHGLGYSKSPEAARFLAGEPLDDDDFRLRAAAVRALGVLGQAEAAAALAPRLADEVAEVRWEAALVLGRLGDRSAAPALRGRLSDVHPEVRKQAVLSLGYLGAAESAAAIEAVRAGDEEAQVREAARAALAMLGKGG
jgi:HEAT repeat protein